MIGSGCATSAVSDFIQASNTLGALAPQVERAVKRLPALERYVANLDRAVMLQRKNPIPSQQELEAYLFASRDLLSKLRQLKDAYGKTNRKMAETRNLTSLGIPIIPIIWGVVALVGALAGGYAVYKIVDRVHTAGKESLTTKIGDLQQQGADPQVVRALSGAYDGLGGMTAQIADAAIRLGTFAALAVLGLGVARKAGFIGRRSD